MRGWVVRKADILVDLGRVGLAEDNQDSVHVADRDPVAGDSLGSAAASVLAGVEHLVFPVDREQEDPDWKQSAQLKMSAEPPEGHRDNYPPVVDSVAEDEPG